MRIKSGGAQGSLISPILFKWYINELLQALSTKFGNECIYAYADDVTILCLGHSEVREALTITEAWATSNGAQLNKKKCGLLSITKREMPIKRDNGRSSLFTRIQVPRALVDQAFTLKFLIKTKKKKGKTFHHQNRVHISLWNILQNQAIRTLQNHGRNLYLFDLLTK